MSCDNYGIIAHYQKVIKKARNDEQKLHYCIEKLFGLPITIEHLQKTGIGKTVNSLRKYNGDVGIAAKALVAKWKAMIANLDIPHKEEGYKVVDQTVRGGVTEVSRKNRSPNEITTNQNIESDQNSNNQTNLTSRDKKVCSELYGSNDKLKHTKSHSLKSKSSKNHDIHFASDTSSLNICSLPEPYHLGPEKKLEITSHEMQPKAKKAKILEKGEIDCTMGASFSDALVMCNEGNNKKHRKLKRQPQEKNSLRSISKQMESNDNDDIISQDLTTFTQNMDASLSLPPKNTTSKIIDNYKPNAVNPNIMDYIYTPIYKEKSNTAKIDALSIGISSKTKRTKVYSGVKTGALLNVPSLFDICIRVLQKNIDALEYTGGVPFEVLRPVLERTSPQQLLTVEDYNAYLMEDTDILWEQHVKRNFRKETKQEGETWREMFLRCEREKEYKLSILTTNIRKAQKESALPVRKTRLAYVDHAVKPPRNIQRKQELFGTNVQLIASPAARVASLSSTSSNVVKAGDPRLKLSKNILHSAGNIQIPQKRAPLMAKTLKFIKKRYKR